MTTQSDAPAALCGMLASAVSGPLLVRGCLVRSAAHLDARWRGVVVEHNDGMLGVFQYLPGEAAHFGINGVLIPRLVFDMWDLDLTEDASIDRANRWLAKHHGWTRRRPIQRLDILRSLCLVAGGQAA